MGVGGAVVACPELHTQSCPSQDFPGRCQSRGTGGSLCDPNTDRAHFAQLNGEKRPHQRGKEGHRRGWEPDCPRALSAGRREAAGTERSRPTPSTGDRGNPLLEDGPPHIWL